MDAGRASFSSVLRLAAHTWTSVSATGVDAADDVVRTDTNVETSKPPALSLRAYLAVSGATAAFTGVVILGMFLPTLVITYAFTDDHNFFFDRSGLADCSQTPDSTSWTQLPLNLYSLEHVFYKLERWGRRKRHALRFRARAIQAGPIRVPLNVFDIVTVVARRR